jgi:hypothetical protein
MVQERWQQQQLAREEAAKLKERVETALAEAIAASSRRCRHRKIGPWAKPSRATDQETKAIAATPVSAKPGLAAAQQQPGEGSLVVPPQPGEGSLVVPQQPGEGTLLSSHNISLVAPLSRPSLAQLRPSINLEHLLLSESSRW